MLLSGHGAATVVMCLYKMEPKDQSTFHQASLTGLREILTQRQNRKQGGRCKEWKGRVRGSWGEWKGGVRRPYEQDTFFYIHELVKE